MRHKGKNQIKALPEYKEFDQKLNSMMLLKAIKKILYTSGSKNLHAKHNKAMAHISLMGLWQKSFKTYRTLGINNWLYVRCVLSWG